MPNYPEADEAQHGHYNDGYSPYASQPTPTDLYDQRQLQYSQFGSQRPIRYEHNQNNGNQHCNPPGLPSPSFVTTSPRNPYQHEQPREVSSLRETSSASSSAPSPPQPVGEHIGALYNPWEVQQMHASHSGQAGSMSAGDLSLLQRDSLYTRTSIQGSYVSGADGTLPGTSSWTNQIPQQVPRRFKTMKYVDLLNGNFVFDSAVPSKLLDRCTLRNDREFTHMRYSAVTCDPNDFEKDGFTLRQIYFTPRRETELFIVITMYNETDELFCRSMQGVIKNIAQLCKRGRSTTWGKDGWKKVVVCIVADGRRKINPRTLSVLAMMGVYQEGIAKSIINGKPVTAHIYEYTTQVSVSVSPTLKIEDEDMCPIQLIFCLKEHNQKKINSHRWFFNAFGPILQPNVCVLLDVGTVPRSSSIYHIWKSFNVDPNVGGACGEIVAYKGKYGETLFNPLVAAQNFEYKMSNILDKPMESVFGYITVLPGAFSAYRYKALRNDDKKGEGPLQKYFLGETLHGAGADIFTANMYLAEDRILCWELVSKREASWTLHYVKSASAVTDVPDRVPELISQRRRWLNGSFFAAVHSIVHFHYIYRSSHSFLRKFWIHIEMFYQLYNLIFSWFALGNYYIAFIIITNALEDYLSIFHWPNLILNYFYLGLLIMSFLLSLGNRPQGTKWAYTLALLGFALIMAYMTVSAFLLAYEGIENVAHSQGGTIQIEDFLTNSIFRNIVLALAATLGVYIVSSLLSFDPWHMITSFPLYLLMAPSYIAVLNVYAFANVHDVSWGTKGDNKVSTDLGVVSFGKGANKNQVEVAVPVEEKDINAAYDDAILLLSTKAPKAKEKVDPTTKQEDYYKSFRTNVLLIWTLSNALLAAVVVSAMPSPGSGNVSAPFVNVYISFILFSITGLAFVRFLGSLVYLIVRLFTGE